MPVPAARSSQTKYQPVTIQSRNDNEIAELGFAGEAAANEYWEKA